jgi:integrase
MLTAVEINNYKPQGRRVRLLDSDGLYLEISPTGRRWWRFKYRFAGKSRKVSLGIYPTVSLKEARQRRDEARMKVCDGIDPGEERKLARLVRTSNAENTFEGVGREWYQTFSKDWKPKYAALVMRRLEVDAFPWLGSRPIREIKPVELLAVLRRIQSRGVLETAHRVLQYASKIFRYGVATGRADRDITVDLRGALPPTRERHHASLVEPAAVGELMRAIDGYSGQFVTKCALRLAALLFVRPGELRRAEWSEIDLNACEWRIPAHRMKMKARHIVPLSRQAVAVLRELQPRTGRFQYVFPGTHSRKRPMCENTINGALRRLGYTGDEMTAHGFRSMASTLLNELGWNRDAIERQLAHAERDAVRAAYNYAEYLPERRRMMQAWADYLDSLASGVPIVSMRSTQAIRLTLANAGVDGTAIEATNQCIMNGHGTGRGMACREKTCADNALMVAACRGLLSCFAVFAHLRAPGWGESQRARRVPQRHFTPTRAVMK